MYLELIERAADGYNIHYIEGGDIPRTNVHYEHMENEFNNPYFITIERGDDIIFRQGITFTDTKIKDEEAYEILAKQFIIKMALAGITCVLNLYKAGTLVPQKYSKINGRENSNTSLR